MLCFALVSLLSAAAQTAPGPTQFYQDLSYVANELPRLHPDLFRNVTRAEFDAGIRQLESECPRLSPEEFYTRLSALIAAARDGHTNIHLDDESPQSRAAGFSALPIEFRWFADGIFVTAAGRPELLRAQLIHIGGAPVQEVIERIRPVIPHENPYFFRFRAASFLRNAGVLRGLGLAPLTGPVQLGLRLETGEETAVDLLPGDATLLRAVDAEEGFVPAWMTRSNEPYWSEYWPHAKTVYIRWLQFRLMNSRPVEEFAAATAALIDRNPVETVVFDVRGNTGGNSSLMMPLLMGLSVRMKALRSNPNFRIYVLADGGTYSSGLFAVEYLTMPALLPEWGPLPPEVVPIRATIAGEPTGGKPAHFGEVKNFTLPGSNILGQHSTQYFALWPGIPDRDALYPDLPVELRSTDFFARHDPVLAAVVGHVESIPDEPAGTALVFNGASLRRETGIAAGSIASALGDFPSAPVEVTVAGREATVVAAAGNRINFLVPSGTEVGRATIEVRKDGQVAAEGQFQVTAAGPGLFGINSPLSSPPGAVLNEDGTLNTREAPAARGSSIRIYGTGYGPLSETGTAEAEVWIAERPADVLSSGPVTEYPGLWQIIARVPAGAMVSGQAPVCVKAHGLASNGVTVFIGR
jgi:uncharacterized protein (TIGR03437 family)